MAAPGTGPDAVFAALEQHFSTGWQVVQVDCQSEPAVEAALALAGFSIASTLIEMVARNVRAAQAPAAIDLEPVGPARWGRLAALVEVDHREGKRTGDYDVAVAAGLLNGMRRRLELCEFSLLSAAGVDAGYGTTVACPGGLGLIESLFTLPGHRGRGLMSAFIVEAARRLHATGCDAVFLDAHAQGTPKRLYATLGFSPAALTRTWVRQV